MFNSKEIKGAARVSEFMMKLAESHFGTLRHERAFEQCIPYGDMAYGSALTDWYQQGCPKDSFFSYAEGEYACPALMEFKAEISAEFGLRILTHEEAEAERMKHKRVLTTKVFDWGLN